MFNRSVLDGCREVLGWLVADPEITINELSLKCFREILVFS